MSQYGRPTIRRIYGDQAVVEHEELLTMNDRLQFLLQKNSFRLEQSQFKLQLQQHNLPDALTCPLSMEDSCVVREKAYALLSSARNGGVLQTKTIEPDHVSALNPILPNGKDAIYIIMPNSKEVGVLKWIADDVNCNWSTLLAICTDGLILVDESFTSLLELDLVDDFYYGVYEMNVNILGDKWLSQIDGVLEGN